jgi:hypothetical protein
MECRWDGVWGLASGACVVAGSWLWGAVVRWCEEAEGEVVWPGSGGAARAVVGLSG